MRIFCLLSSLAFMGGTTGDVLWRAGVAALVADIPCILLWPRSEPGAKA
ncbi:MAG: hypothetical protein KJ067_08730 [Vicinamibacteria bacterium]|nr:hypothetical protein [Vicinamibacteria bacterium]